MTAGQCKAARALLGWNVGRLAEETGLSRATIFRYESGKDSLFSNVKKMQEALEAGGVEFEGAVGVRLKKD